MRHIVWSPQAGPQHALVRCPFPEVFFGGARGGGKTDGILGKWGIKAGQYGEGFNAIFFRKTMPSADDVWERACWLYSRLGGIPHLGNNTIRFPNGARVRFRPLERLADADKYQGQNVSDVCVEEAGLYADSRPIDRLHGVLRSVAGVPTQMILTANPGGAGHGWIKTRYVDPAPGGMVPLSRALPNGDVHEYIYIPSRVQDNRILMESDPSYVTRLYLVGSEQLVKAWLEGDWSAVEGAFFDWNSARHVVEPFAVPEHWLRFRSMDWGYAAPFSVGWWAVVSDDMRHGALTLPRGCMVRYREWYGAARGAGGAVDPNVGIRMEADEVARRIAEIEADEAVTYGVLDPSAFSQDGGPSIAERMAVASGGRLIFRKADNKRVGAAGALGGWDMMRQRLRGAAPDRPMLVTFATCSESIRTIPVLQHDPDRMEDLDTDAEDHAADEWRYGCMSRPWTRSEPVPIDDTIRVEAPTFASLTRQIERQAGQRRRI